MNLFSRTDGGLNMKRACFLLLTIILHQGASALSVSTSVMASSICGRPSGYALAWASGGTPPYTYSWSNGATEANVFGLVNGTYTVTVTDAVLDQATADAVIPLQSSYDYGYVVGTPLGYCSGDPYQLALFTGQNNLIDPYDPTGIYGPSPYSFSHPNLIDYTQSAMCMTSTTPVYNMLSFSGAPGTMYQVDFWDADGCPGTMNVIVEQPFTPPALQIVGVGPSCQNGATGSMTVAVSGSAGKEFGIYVRAASQSIACYASDVTGFTCDGYNQFDGLKTFTYLQPGDNYLIWTTDPFGLFEGNAFYNYECRDSILFNVPVVAADCGNLTGRLYLDDDADCNPDGGENRVPNSIVTVEPGPYYLTTDNNGQYTSALPYGSYTVNEQHPVFTQSCPAPVTLSNTVPQTVNTACAGGQPLDVFVTLGSGAARPGFVVRYGTHVENLTPSSTGTVTLTLEVDPMLTYVSASPTPTSVAGNIISWTAPQFTMTQVFQHCHFYVDLQVPPDVLLIGTSLNATATITTQNTDADLSNNTYDHSVIISGSVDPNDKVAATSSGLSDSQYFLQQDEWIDYTIRFQNTGTDTAFNILITDTLPPELDPGSVLMGAASHPYTWSMGIMGELHVIYNDILLPDSNVNEAASHGFVLLRVKPQDDLLPGTQISNTANIFFDFNPAVITEPSVLVAEFSTEVNEFSDLDFRLFPNPTQEGITITSSEKIASVRFMSTDGRVLREWAANKTIVELELDGFVPGLYLIQGRSVTGRLMSRSFIKL